MIRTLLASASLLFIANDAFAALERSVDGKGDALYLPYYTVESGLSTVVTVTNHSSVATAAHVLFAEALNGQQVFAFNIYLPPRGQWSGTVNALGADAARLEMVSGSCSMPVAVAEGRLSFAPWDYAFNYPDGGDTSTMRTRTGAVEILEFGSLTGAMAAEAVAGDCNALERRYTQVSPDPPPPRLPLLAMPTRQLSAQAQVIDVARGSTYSIEGVAISGFFGRPVDMESDDVLARISAPVLAENESRFTLKRDDGIYSVAANRAPDAISALFMSRWLDGDVLVDASRGAQTAWVVGFPTRHAYVADLPGSLVPPSGESMAPFAADFLPNGACETMQTTRASMLGASLPSVIASTQPAAQGDAFCGQVNLRLLGANNGSVRGTDRIDLTGAGRVLTVRRESDGANVSLRGLPATGSRVTRVVASGQSRISFATPLRPAESPATSGTQGQMFESGFDPGDVSSR